MSFQSVTPGFLRRLVYIKVVKHVCFRRPPRGLPQLSGEGRREAEGHPEVSSLLPHHEEMLRPRNPSEAGGGLQLPLQRGETDD